MLITLNIKSINTKSFDMPSSIAVAERIHNNDNYNNNIFLKTSGIAQNVISLNLLTIPCTFMSFPWLCSCWWFLNSKVVFSTVSFQLRHPSGPRTNIFSSMHDSDRTYFLKAPLFSSTTALLSLL